MGVRDGFREDIMRISALALISACVLAACNPSAPSGGGLFPNLTDANYRAEATISGDNGQNVPVVMIRSGNKVRMEMNVAGQGGMVVVNNADTQENFVLMTNGGQTYAIQADPSQYDNPIDNWNAEYASNATRTGDCSVAGENGAAWTRDVEGEPHTACVTPDGIILRATEGERVVWETTSVQRGPQDPALFTMPEGVQTMDLSAMMGQAGISQEHVSSQVCDALRNSGAPPERIAQAGC
jgi:hypothetical protein